MKQISVLVLLLSCFTICAAETPAECNLTGQWTNDLGANMTISDISDDGIFSGSYVRTESATETIVELPVIGFQESNGSPLFGFTVKWTFSSSIAVFTGQCYITETGETILKTTWLLRSQSETIEDDWEQTRVGTSIFQKMSCS